MFINGVGGDCPGKAEISKEVVEMSSIFVEYLPQTKIEEELKYWNKLKNLANGKRMINPILYKQNISDKYSFEILDSITKSLIENY